MNWKEKFRDVLSPLLTLYTITYIGLMLVDFILKEKFDMPDGMMVVYIALVGAYSVEKEVKRWVGQEDPPRKGSIYVYFWLLFFLIAFVMSSIDKAFVLPKDLTAVALQVLGIFFGSKASKKIYEASDKKLSNEEKYTTREEQVLAVVNDKGKVTRKEVVEILKVSDSTAGRILAGMEKVGKISQVGDFKDAYYIKSTGSKPENK
ncbi:DeoR family transcriptional regulator [bacterium]|nr:DeoR family transcriptional regulator [bacterium]